MIEPANRLGPRSLPLKPGEWNTVVVSLANDTVTLKLNDTVVYSRPLEPGLRRTFGFHHDRAKSSARVRDVVLRGYWPEQLALEHRDNLLALAGPQRNEAHRQTLGRIFNDEHVGDAALTVHRRAMQMAEDARYEYLANWVLPGVDHDTIRVALDFTPTHPAMPVQEVDSIDRHRLEVAAADGLSRIQIGGNLVSPAIDLIHVAKELGRLEEVKKRAEEASLQNGQQIQARHALLVLVGIAQGDFTSANNNLDQLFALVETDVSTDFESRWPETLAMHGAMHEPATRELAVLVYDRQLRPGRQSGVPAWETCIRAMVGQARYFDVPDDESSGRTMERHWTAPRLREWQPVSRTTARTRGQGFARPHWQPSNARVVNFSGHEMDFLYYHIPLQGNYQVEGDLDAFGWRDATLSIGGTWVLTMPNQAAYTFGGFRSTRGRVELTPKLSRIRVNLHFRGAVEDGVYCAFVNGREIHKETLTQPVDPWVRIQSRKRHHGGVTNLKITGDPVIPEELVMTARNDLAGWLPYYGTSIGAKNRHWRQRGDIAGGGGIVGKYQPASTSFHIERLLRYHRPMLEDGAIEYEFYYRDGVSLVHPVLDRLALLLDPQGVRVHWMTDGAFDRTGLRADNAADEPENRRGPNVLPLVPNAWNDARVTLKGDVVGLFLNGQLVYERELEITNQRTFGLFHYADQTEARVRFMKWRGDWPRELPPVAEQELAGPDTAFLDERLTELTAVFHYDFAESGFDSSRIALVRNSDGGTMFNRPEGLQLIRPGGGAFMSTIIAPGIAVRGDFDVSVAFEEFESQVTTASQSAVMLQLVMAGETRSEAVLNRRHTLSATEVEQQLIQAAASLTVDGETRRNQLVMGPGESPGGTFRIARRGDQIYYLYSEGDNAPFRILVVNPATSDDIEPKGVRLITQAKGGAHGKVVWKSITVHAEKLLRLRDPNSPDPGLLWVMNADGTELKKITAPISGYQSHGSPSWSPDGKRILFDCWGGSPSKSKMFVVNADGTELKELGTGAMPSFSADGKKIAFTASDGMTIMDVDGSNREVVDERGWSVQWSPDGRMLAYGNGGNITVFDLATKEKRSILEGEHASLYNYTFWNLEWSRDSRRICFKARKDALDEQVRACRRRCDGLIKGIRGGVLQPEGNADRFHLASGW